MEARVNFFLIGAAKSGTTALYERMNKHPDVYLSPLKEPNYFSTDIDPTQFSEAFKANTQLDLSDYFAKRPLSEKQVGFVRSEEQYDLLFSDVHKEQVVGECSTSYLYSKNAPSEVHRYFPEARILVVLRNPIERLFSHYLMARKYGFTSDDLRTALRKDREKKQKGWGQSELYVELGMYGEQLSRWLDVFPRDQVKVLFTQDLKKDHIWSELYNWLGIEVNLAVEAEKKAAHEGDSVHKKTNMAGLARWEGMNKWLTDKGLKKTLGRLIPPIIKEKLLFFYYTDVNLPTLSEADRQYIASLYDSDRVRLEQLIGRPVPWN